MKYQGYITKDTDSNKDIIRVGNKKFQYYDILLDQGILTKEVDSAINSNVDIEIDYSDIVGTDDIIYKYAIKSVNILDNKGGK